MAQTIFLLFVLLVLAFALGPAFRASLNEAFPSFIAFFFLLLRLRIAFAEFHDPEILLGDLFASLGLTYFWIMRRK